MKSDTSSKYESPNGRILKYTDIEAYLKQHPIEDLRLYKYDNSKYDDDKYDDKKNPISNALQELEKNDGKQDFLKKIIVAPEQPDHTSFIIYGICNGQKICFTSSNSMRCIFEHIANNNNAKINFLLSTIQQDQVNCGVFAIECCKHLSLDDFKKILANREENLDESCIQNTFTVNTISLPASLQKYDQMMTDDKIKALQEQNPKEYEKLIQKIKKKNFIYKGTSAERKDLFENLKEGTAIFDIMNPSDLMNKAASHKRKKIVNLTDKTKENKNNI